MRIKSKHEDGRLFGMFTQHNRKTKRHYQENVSSYFEKTASFWIGMYENKGVHEFIHQQRLQVVLELVDLIDLPQDPRALDIGCGAGRGTVGIAKRGYLVEAIDPVQTMIESTRNLARQAGLDHRVRTNLGDVHALCFPSGTFALILAVGVLPWLSSIEQPLREMCRVLRPGGYLIVTVDNRWALRWVFEPQTSPLLTSTKKIIRSIIRRPDLRQRRVQSVLTSIWNFDALLDAAGLEKLNGITLGFGPFTFFGHHLFSDDVELRLHRMLQRLAHRKVRMLRSLGSQYIVFARKRA
jgi:SAM-dependent methyltransferase